MNGDTLLVAGIDVQRDGITARLSFSLPAPSADTPSLAASPAAAASEGTEDPQAVLAQVAAGSVPLLLEAFARVQTAVLESRCLLLQRQVRELQRAQSTRDVAASPRRRGLGCLDALVLLCDPEPGGLAVTRARLVDDLKNLTSREVQERLLARGVESSLDFIADLQAEVAQHEHGGAVTGGEPHQGPARSSVHGQNDAGVHRPSVDGGTQ